MTRSRRWITLRHWGSRTSTCRRSCRPRSARKHGYDVTDHTSVAEGLGGDAGFARLVEAAHGAGLGVVVDVVPNHMTTPTPLSLNRPLWSVLREGRHSAYATWFDVDWDARTATSSCRCWARRSTTCSRRAEISVGEHEGETVAEYYDHVFPVAPGSEPACRSPSCSTRSTTVSRRGRSATAELNYRRFFDVTSLIAVRVEDPEVFDATHRAARRRHPVRRHRRAAHRPPRRARRPGGLPRAAR